MPALRQAAWKRAESCLAKIPFPRMREPKFESLSLPPRTARIAASTFSLRSGMCWASHSSNSGPTAYGSRTGTKQANCAPAFAAAEMIDGNS